MHLSYHLVEDSPATSKFEVASEPAVSALSRGEIRRYDAVADEASRAHKRCGGAFVHVQRPTVRHLLSEIFFFKHVQAIEKESGQLQS